MKTRSLTLLAASLAAVAVAAACQVGTTPEDNHHTASFAYAPGIPAPQLFVPDEAEAAYFHDSQANIDLIQVYAWDDSFGTGVFLQFPASAAAQTGTVPLDAGDVGVRGWFSTSEESEEWDQRWQFALHGATLVVVSAANAPGQTIAVAVSGGTFVFENEDGQRNHAVTALLGSTQPAIAAELDDDPILGCW